MPTVKGKQAAELAKKLGLEKPGKRHKYNATPTFVDGIRFASKKEANRYSELQVMLRSGEICDLELQISFALMANGVVVGYYLADFRYQDKNGCTIVEDVKGMKTPVYRLKKKIVEAMYGITITEV